MAASTIAPFGHGSIENIARIIGELYTGPELTRILASVGMPDTLGAGQTKWKRLAASMQEKQYSQRDGRPILAVITAAMKPDMIWDRQAKAAVARDELTQVLSLSGYRAQRAGGHRAPDRRCLRGVPGRFPIPLIIAPSDSFGPGPASANVVRPA